MEVGADFVGGDGAGFWEGIEVPDEHGPVSEVLGDAAVAAFMAALALPDLTRLRLDHISALLALLLEGPYRYAALDLLYQSYTPGECNYISST